MERANRDGRAWQEAGNASAQQSGPDAFTAAFTRLAPGLYDFLARLSGRPEAADALLRQAASQAAMSAVSAPQWPSVRAWLFARAVAVLPAESSGANTNPAPFSDPDPARLRATPPDSGLPDMARVVWRAVSALSIEQHALLHLCSREGMSPGEAASVLGITVGEATDRLGRVVTAVEETSRALFLIRYGRARDPQLNELLADRNVTRLTPELRGFLDTYLRTSPSAQAMLHAVPAPLAIYTAFRPLPIPEGLTAAAAASALPWLASGTRVSSAESGAAGAASQTGVMPDGAGATTYIPETAPPAFGPGSVTAVNDVYRAYAVAPDRQTTYTPATPAVSPTGYDPHTYGAGAYDSYGYGASTGYSDPPAGSGQIEGTQTLEYPRAATRGDEPAHGIHAIFPPVTEDQSPRDSRWRRWRARGHYRRADHFPVTRFRSTSRACDRQYRRNRDFNGAPGGFQFGGARSPAYLDRNCCNRLLTATAMVAVTPTAIATSSPPPQLIRTSAPDLMTATAFASGVAGVQ